MPDWCRKYKNRGDEDRDHREEVVARSMQTCKRNVWQEAHKTFRTLKTKSLQTELRNKMRELILSNYAPTYRQNGLSMAKWDVQVKEEPGSHSRMRGSYTLCVF